MIRKLFFNNAWKRAALQPLLSRLHTWILFLMNYGGGAWVESSGEEWVLANVVRPAVRTSADPVVFDVGANEGEYALAASRHLPGARIYSFEPVAASFRKLSGAVERSNVLAFELGFSDVPGCASIRSYTVDGQPVSALSSLHLRHQTFDGQLEIDSVEEIQLDTLDRFCEDAGIAHIDFLKMDVEGSELLALKGAGRLIESRAIRMIQFEFGPTNIYSKTYFFDFWSMLSPLYSIHRIIPNGLAPISYYSEHREVFLTTNYLAILKAQ
jgi:FkbM family methyltransferase